MSQKGVEASTKVEIGTVQVQAKATGFLAQTCSSCGREMTLGEGDTLFGDKWFHGLCWALEAEAKR
jgi:hypothetical protein